MRSLKYRAWDGILRQFIYVELNHGILSLKVISHHGIPYISDLDNWQEYTSLKDKNGEDIYEGDLIEVTYYDYAEGHGKVKTGHAILEVAYDEMMAGFAPFVDGSCPTKPDDAFADWQVVGNIYTDRHLLKEEHETS